MISYFCLRTHHVFVKICIFRKRKAQFEFVVIILVLRQSRFIRKLLKSPADFCTRNQTLIYLETPYGIELVFPFSLCNLLPPLFYGFLYLMLTLLASGFLNHLFVGLFLFFGHASCILGYISINVLVNAFIGF